MINLSIFIFFLLQTPGLVSQGHLLAAVLEALCDSTVKLTRVLPILRDGGHPDPSDSVAHPPAPFAKQLSMEDSPSAAQAEARAQFPELVVHMEDKVQVQGEKEIHVVSWEPEGRYCSSKMFRWEPEGRYCCTKSMAIAPFWFSTEHLWSAIAPFWLSTDDVIIHIVSWEPEGHYHCSTMFH